MAVRSLDEQSLFEGARSAATAELREAYLKRTLHALHTLNQQGIKAINFRWGQAVFL